MAQFIKKKKGWAVRFYTDELDSDNSKKRVYLSGYKTKQDANKAMVRYLSESKGGVIQDSNICIQQLCEYWFDNYASEKLAPRTQVRYGQMIRNHIIPKLGSFKIKDIKPTQLQDFYKWLQYDCHLSKCTTYKYHKLLHLIYNCAIRWELAHNNPTNSVIPPKPEENEMNVLTEEQLTSLYKELVGNPAFIPIFISSTTGMRLAEVCGLQNDDVSIVDEMIYVRHQYQRIYGKMLLRSTKTHRSTRPIYILPETIPILKRYIIQKKEEKLRLGPSYQENNFFSVWEDGRPVLPDYVTRQFRKAADKLGLTSVRFHDLRHTHATILLKQKKHPKVVSERLGHKKIELTLNTYSHVIPDIQRDMLQDTSISSVLDIKKELGIL